MLFIVYISQIQAKDDVLPLNMPRSLTLCPQQLQLNRIIASYSHDDKENNYELRIKKVGEIRRIRVISKYRPQVQTTVTLRQLQKV
jgi:hypothetical protein